MKTYTFKNGDQMPILGLGTWKSTPGEVYNAVKQAIALGYRHIDCAPIYGNESEVGQAITDSISAGVVRREELWITSKLWNDCHAPEDVEPAIERTLTDLQLDYLNLFLIHWPVALKKGVPFPGSAEDLISLDKLPLAITWKAMEDLVDKGLTRHIGVSNFSAQKIAGLIESGNMKPEVNQVELHPYLQQDKLVEFCNNKGVHLTAYSPLGSPDRPDNLKTKDEPVLLEDPVIRNIALKSGITAGQVLITWALLRGTSVIPKSVNPSRMKENLESASLSLLPKDMDDINRLDKHRRYVDGEFWAIKGSSYSLSKLWDEQV